MRKRILVLGLMAVLAAAFSAPSFAARAIQGTVGEVSAADGAALGPVGFRVWSAMPGGETNVNDNVASCRNVRCIRTYITNTSLAPGGYVGNQEATQVYNGDATDQVFYQMVDADMGTGGGNHILYYGAAGVIGNSAGVGSFLLNGCSGSTATNCFPRLDNSSGAPDLTGTSAGYGGPLHTIRHIGGMAPVPNVKVTTGGLCPSGSACLSWDNPHHFSGNMRGSSTTPTPPPSPVLGVNLWSNDRPDCTAPGGNDPGWVPRGAHNSGDNSTVDGPLPNGGGCRFYGLSVRLVGAGSAGETEPGVAGQRSIGTNSQPVSTGPTAVRIVRFDARYAGHGVVNVAWQSGIEGDVSGFYVTRGLTASGPYTRVSDLVAAKGDNSRYVSADHIGAGQANKTLYYRLEIVQRDGGVSNSSPAAVTVPGRSKKSGPSIR